MKRLLIVRFSAMGDVAMMVPVVSSLAKQYPELDITVLSRPFARHFFSNIAENVNFIGVDVKKDYKGIAGLNRLYNELKTKEFDYVADFHDVLRTQFLRLRFWLSGTKTAHINKHRAEKKALVRKKACNYHQLPTSFDNYAEVLEKLGFPVRLEFNSIFCGEKGIENKGDFSIIADRIEVKKEGERWYGIAPFAAHEGKIYPQEKLKEVVELLTKDEPKSRVFFFGNGEKEHTIIHHLINNNAQCIDASEVLKGLSEELILMSHLDVMLSMDSANMHLASLVGTRVVSIWGATHPYAGFLGWNQKAEDAVQTDEKCRPCSIYGNKKCIFNNYPCMNINPQIVKTTLQNG